MKISLILAITIVILISITIVYFSYKYIYPFFKNLLACFINNNKTKENPDDITDSNSLSDFVYAFGIGILTSSLVSLGLPIQSQVQSHQLNYQILFENFLLHVLPFLTGLTLILCKDKIKKQDKICILLSFSLTFTYIFYILFYVAIPQALP